MRMDSFPGLQDICLDSGLTSFQAFFSFFLDAPERARASGKKVVAKSPLAPPEVIFAAGALPYDIVVYENLVQSMLENRVEMTHQAVEAGISPELSPWQLIMLGSELNGHGTVPVDMYTSVIGGFDDQLTKSFQVIARSKSLPLRFFEVPRYEPSAEGWALPYLEKELSQLVEWLELRTKSKVTDESLHKAISETNQVREDLIALDSILAGDRVPLGSLEYYLLQAFVGDYCQNPGALHELLLALITELRKRVDSGFSAQKAASPIRLYLMGDMTQELSLFNSIENHGGCLVGCDFRWPLYYDLIPEDASPLAAFARWVWRMPVNLPVAGRIKAEARAIKQQKPDAIIINSTVGSRFYPGAEKLTRDILKEELGLPVLTLETSLPGENMEKVDYQLRAFLEMMR